VKILKRILLGLLSLLLVLVLVFAGVVTWVLKNPEAAWKLAEKHFFPEDLKITWQNIDFTTKHVSGLNFDVDWTVGGLNIQKGTPFLAVPVKNIHLLISLFPKGTDKKFILHTVQVNAPDTIKVRLVKPPQKEPEQNPYQTARGILSKVEKFSKWAAIDDIDVAVADVQFSNSENAVGKNSEPAPIRFSFEGHQHGKKDPEQVLHFETKVLLLAEKPVGVRASGELKLPAMGSGKPFLEAKIQFHGSGVTTEQSISFVSYEEKVLLQSAGEINYAAEKIHLVVNPRLSVKLSKDQAVTELAAQFSGLPGPVVKVDRFKLSLKTPLEKDLLWSEKPSEFVASAPIALFFVTPDMRKSLEKSCECRIPEVLQFELKGKTWLANALAEPAETKPVLDSALSVESVHNKLLSVDLAAKMKIDKKSHQYQLTPALDCEASINSFQGLVHLLEARNVLVPAPFNLLNGTIKLSSHDLVKTSDNQYSLPATVVAKLTSPRQSIDVTTNTVVKMSASFKEMFVDIVAKIADLQLELPPLDPMKGKPRITLDQRILKAPAKEKSKPSNFKIYLSLAAETTKPGAIRFLSKYFKPYLPMTISLHRSSEKDNTGFLKTEPFAIEYLRRRVEVVRMRIDLPEKEDAPLPVNARFKIKQTQYTVFINLTGPINKPEISMTSVPYLPENEIISVLLYDRVSSELAGSDAETAGNVQAAMADRAIGLFGLWAFAATPIKSFSYNTVTKVYTATVALSDDVTAGIGTNWEEATRLELRKRVSKSWMLTAAWVPATQNEDQKTNLVLQWEKRF
jgi:hypothetical protein